MRAERAASSIRALWRVAVLATCVLALSVASASAAPLVTRAPTAAERAAITQAAFDYYFTNAALSSEQISHIRILRLPRPEALGSRFVSKYAALTVLGKDTAGQSVGAVLALAVFYSSPQAGWRVYNDGSVDVGCAKAWYPQGEQRSIMDSLGLTCPG